MYRSAWKIEHGLESMTDEQADYWYGVLRDRADEERTWTPHFFRRLFGIRTARSGQASKGVDKEAVREAADVTRLLDALGIRWTRRGDRVTFCCVFHSEKNPSASFSFSKKAWYCHSGCARGGDLFGFWAEFNGCSFAEAVQSIHSLG